MTRDAVIEAAEVRRHPERDALTLLCFGAVGIFGFVSNAIGPVLPFLQVELSIGREQAGAFSILLALGLLVVGLTGRWVVARVGRRLAFWAGLIGVTGGALLVVATPWPIIVAGGIALIGAGGAMLVFLVPAILSDRHGHLATRAIVESTGVLSAAAILAPLLISLTVTIGLGWRVGYIALPLGAAIALFIVGRATRFEGTHLDPSPGPRPGTAVSHAPGSYRRRWLDVLLVVSVELCLVFWSADYLVTILDVEAAVAAAIVSLFFIGMAVGRLGGGQLNGSQALFVGALAVTAVGFAIFWLAPVAAVAAVGLFVTGLGVALLYPLSISRALAAWPSDPDRASARGALASGLAFGIAPFALAVAAERVGLRTAFLIVPALVAAVIANTFLPADRWPTVSRRSDAPSKPNHARG